MTHLTTADLDRIDAAAAAAQAGTAGRWRTSGPDTIAQWAIHDEEWEVANATAYDHNDALGCTRGPGYIDTDAVAAHIATADPTIVRALVAAARATVARREALPSPHPLYGQISTEDEDRLLARTQTEERERYVAGLKAVAGQPEDAEPLPWGEPGDNPAPALVRRPASPPLPRVLGYAGEDLPAGERVSLDVTTGRVTIDRPAALVPEPCAHCGHSRHDHLADGECFRSTRSIHDCGCTGWVEQP